jgi:hypothetical protein
MSIRIFNDLHPGVKRTGGTTQARAVAHYCPSAFMRWYRNLPKEVS